MTTLFLLDSGDPQEYKTLSEKARRAGCEIWGSTTNPSLIAKKLAGRKVSREEAFRLQKEIVFEILSLVPGAVSAEVYADQNTKASEMIEQGMDIGSWDKRVIVKLPTNLEGLRARTELRKNKIPTNNTLVFSAQQIFAICLHEKLCQKEYGPIDSLWPPFISPFVGRLDDLGENGMDLIKNGMEIKSEVGASLWMLEASVRNAEHIAQGEKLGVETITAPANILEGWFDTSGGEERGNKTYVQNLKEIASWRIPEDLKEIDNLDDFFTKVKDHTIDINHPLTEKGIARFANDWQAILTE